MSVIQREHAPDATVRCSPEDMPFAQVIGAIHRAPAGQAALPTVLIVDADLHFQCLCLFDGLATGGKIPVAQVVLPRKCEPGLDKKCAITAIVHLSHLAVDFTGSRHPVPEPIRGRKARSVRTKKGALRMNS